MKAKDLNAWLDAEPGRATWLANQFGINKSAISLWREAGVPMTRMVEIVRLTKGAVTINAMVEHATEMRSKRTAKA